LFYITSANYNTDNKIESISTVKYSGPLFTNSMFVEYEENKISRIHKILDRENSDANDQDIIYDVEVSDNTILLTSENDGIEISHSNGYIDSIVEFSIDNPSSINGNYYTRDDNQNLISNKFNNGNVVNSYSDYDSNKKTDQRGIVIDFPEPSYLNIFNLKLTANNPRNTSQTLLGNEGPTQYYTYEYDELGFITKTNSSNSTSYQDSFILE